MLGRTVNEATSFRFLHSYLYEPQPATGQYWFSDNVWHDAKAELPVGVRPEQALQPGRRPRRAADADAVPHLRR